MENMSMSVKVKKTNCITQFLRGSTHIFVFEGREGVHMCEQKYTQGYQSENQRTRRQILRRQDSDLGEQM